MLWVSKERILDSQLLLLRNHNYDLLIYNKDIYNVEDFLQEVKRVYKIKDDEPLIIIPIAPESIKMKLLEEIKKNNLPWRLFEPEMKELGRFKSLEECERLTEESRDKRVYIRLKDGECKVYEFVRFREILEYHKVYGESIG